MPDDDLTRFTLRMPRELYERLSQVSAERNRSTNAEVVSRLEASFEPAENQFRINRDIRRAMFTSNSMMIAFVQIVDTALTNLRNKRDEPLPLEWEALESAINHLREAAINAEQENKKALSS